MNLLMVSSECLPFSKTGGLGDVAYSLSKELVKDGVSVSIATPFYGSIKKEKYNFNSLYKFVVTMNWRKIETEVFHVEYEGIDYYLFKNDHYFNRNNGLYGYYDDGEVFAYFSNAVIEFMKLIPYKFDIVHVHDWQTAMIPCLIKNKFNGEKAFLDIKTVLTIHNPLFKGYFNGDSLYDLYGLDYSLFKEGKVRLENQVSTLKAGIVYSDKITTVSPTHADELKTPEGSKGLWYDLILRQDDFSGILNGMDYKEFDPSKDKIIYHQFNKKNLVEGKNKNREAFYEEYNLEKGRPLFSVVSRLTSQKGLDLINAMMDFALDSGANIAILGSGEKQAEDFYQNLHTKFPHNVMVYIGYSDAIAHKIYASSDFFIMPSAFEPCGLGQMIAQRYGALPIVRRTGGLKDSVIPYDIKANNYKNANGFGFDDYRIVSSLKTVAHAMMVYDGNQEIFNRLRLNAITVDHSWKKSSKEYIKLYNSMFPNKE